MTEPLGMSVLPVPACWSAKAWMKAAVSPVAIPSTGDTVGVPLEDVVAS